MRRRPAIPDYKRARCRPGPWSSASVSHSDPMITPTATYRLQFRNGMTFDHAAKLAPYLARLGISHLYAAPIFQAEPGSTHGYDVVDNRVIDSSLGGDAGFERMVAAQRAEGIGIVLDFVPNHMSASTYNPYWRDVLEWGEASDCAQFFDIDWSASKLLVPALGTSYGRALEEGKFGLHFDARDGGMTFTYYDLKLPLTPTSYAPRPFGEVLALGPHEHLRIGGRR